jgi:acyl carrier protein
MCKSIWGGREIAALVPLRESVPYRAEHRPWVFDPSKVSDRLWRIAEAMSMTNQELLLEVDKILGLRPGTLRGEERLDELENWDSTALISFVALAEGQNGVQISPVQIVGCSTVDDLIRLATLQASPI